jgi:antitoxin component HigA of HigAB toxin-antitoxin module
VTIAGKQKGPTKRPTPYVQTRGQKTAIRSVAPEDLHFWPQFARIMLMQSKPSPPVTPAMAAEIRYLRKQKGLFTHQIAALFGINQGRVSEVLTGKRFPDVPPAQGSLF